MKKTSDCCDAPIRLSNPNARRGQTVYWICTKCENPCDEKVKISELIEGENSSLKKTFDAATTPHVMDINVPKNKPQLSAEQKIIKEFKNEFGEIYLLSTPIPSFKRTRVIASMGMAIENFLATALEKQRAEYVRKVNIAINEEETIDDTIWNKALSRAKKRVLAILNGEDTDE